MAAQNEMDACNLVTMDIMLLSEINDVGKDELHVLYVDARRAYLYATSVRPTYIKLRSEDPRSSE